MFFWSIKWSIISLIIIVFIHYFYEFFKNKFTKQKVYNILNSNTISDYYNPVTYQDFTEVKHNHKVAVNNTTMIDNSDTTMIDNSDTTMIVDNNSEMKEELINFLNTLKNN